MNRMRIFDIIYALAARDGRDAALFGNCLPAAQEAFARSLVGDTFPELWFELPLTGEPWFDFHALVSYEEIAGTQAAFAGHGGAYADALTWFANQEAGKVRQLALSYDTSAGDVDHPAVQLLADRSGIEIPFGFLDAAGRPDLKDPLHTFYRSLPQGWYACYVGIFPNRDTSRVSPWVRVECIVGEKCQQAYANDGAVLREHLAQIGMNDFGDDVISGIQMLARSPFPLELQFNVGADGKVLPVISASLRFQPEDWTSESSLRSIGGLVHQAQSLGVADDRCNLLANSIFSKKATTSNETVYIAGYPAFVKLRWREGLPPDAKTYLIAYAALE